MTKKTKIVLLKGEETAELSLRIVLLACGMGVFLSDLDASAQSSVALTFVDDGVEKAEFEEVVEKLTEDDRWSRFILMIDTDTSPVLG